MRQTLRLYIWWFAMVACCMALNAQGQTQTESAPCGMWRLQHANSMPDISPGDAVIFGRNLIVPTLRFQLIDGESGKPLQPELLTVHFGWRWLRYPYPEHAWGVWENAADQIDCKVDAQGWVTTPRHEVKPRGWYAGVYTKFPWQRKPMFDGVSVTMRSKEHLFPNFSLSDRELERMQHTPLLVRVYDGWRVEKLWQ